MKSTGIVRQVDDLGRVVIPSEIRSILQFNKNEPMEIYVEEETIILQRYSPGCILCGEIEGAKILGNKKVCQRCVEELKEESK